MLINEDFKPVFYVLVVKCQQCTPSRPEFTHDMATVWQIYVLWL